MTGSLLERWHRRRARRLCEEARARIQELVDAEMPPGRKRQRIADHVEVCVMCGASAAQIRSLKEAIARVGREPDPRVKARLTEVIDEIRSGDVEV